MSLSYIEKRFLYYTECACATVDSMPKSWSKSQRQRLFNIADGMIVVCMGILGPNTPEESWDEARHMAIPRTLAALQRRPDNST